MSGEEIEPAQLIAETESEALDPQRGQLLVCVLESLLLASEQPLSIEQLHRLLSRELGVGKKDLREALARLDERLAGGATELREVASGFRVQVRKEYAEWVSKLWQEKPPRLSRALLETLALITYRQPITRGEIEEVRGVALSPNIIRTLLERGWIREVGVKEVPGRPSLFGTTPQLLDDLNVKTLDDLPSLPEIKDPEQLDAAMERLGEQLHEPQATADAAARATQQDDPLPDSDEDPGHERAAEQVADAPPAGAMDDPAGVESEADDDGEPPVASEGDGSLEALVEDDAMPEFDAGDDEGDAADIERPDDRDALH
ncbi:MAG: SMC-Scp complex subunit ScpB [Nevskiales bacterium]|nr:SMC-Scp complex subunit ScpB [Nevskiales bacterium]